MRTTPICLAAAAVALAGCADRLTFGDQRFIYAAVAPPGPATLLESHATVGLDCAIGPAPAVTIVEQGELGVATTAPATKAFPVPEPSEDPLAQDDDEDAEECSGFSAPATAVFYEPAQGALGTDTVVYRVIRDDSPFDQIYTARVAVK